MRAWYLETTSWQGIAIGAIHYYAKLVDPDYKVHQVEITLSVDQAAVLNQYDRHVTYEAGDQTSRWDDKKDLCKAGLVLFQAIAPSTDVLLKGNHCSADPLEPLFGPTEAVTELRKIWRDAEDIGWWEGVEKTMHQIAKPWACWWEKHADPEENL